MRLRVTLDITFPAMFMEPDRDNVLDLLAQLVDVINQNAGVRCEDVRLQSSESISLTE